MATLTLFSIFEIILLTDTEMKQILTKINFLAYRLFSIIKSEHDVWKS
jgi:hypothetical protein